MGKRLLFLGFSSSSLAAARHFGGSTHCRLGYHYYAFVDCNWTGGLAAKKMGKAEAAPGGALAGRTAPLYFCFAQHTWFLLSPSSFCDGFYGPVLVLRLVAPAYLRRFAGGGTPKRWESGRPAKRSGAGPQSRQVGAGVRQRAGTGGGCAGEFSDLCRVAGES